MATNELERNVGYVVEVIKENDKIWYELSTLIMDVRHKHDNSPLSIDDALNAIHEAEKRKLIKKNNYSEKRYRYILNKQ